MLLQSNRKHVVSKVKVIKRNGAEVDFDISRIVAAISKACIADMEREVDDEIYQVIRYVNHAYQYISHDRWLFQDLEKLKERKRQIRRLRKIKTEQIHAMIRNAWLSRNTSTCRSRTSAVSDLSLQTIPTPPTAAVANRTLRRGGVLLASV